MYCFPIFEIENLSNEDIVIENTSLDSDPLVIRGLDLNEKIYIDNLLYVVQTDEGVNRFDCCNLLPRIPELENLHKQVKQKCILDGELIAFKNGSPDFYEIQRRAVLTDPFKIRLSANSVPATYLAYDIIYLNDEEVTWEPLMKRKELLSSVVVESERIAISRYIERNGKSLLELAKQQNLEGIVAKHKESKYWFGMKKISVRSVR
ncbi:hypothetical protein [Metaclostridioides mangenotii]|uniref:ATP-dependent DNA ligase n=1 Tax=Metaclostridioides mangenotii TaxID=1540 RepID=UPI00068933D5|nr:hypothetical protein [Clostridioides mangenotii]